MGWEEHSGKKGTDQAGVKWPKMRMTPACTAGTLCQQPGQVLFTPKRKLRHRDKGRTWMRYWRDFLLTLAS
jgi:hypothetical protein